MLSRFISLTDADSILRFAETWGVLALQLPETGGTVLRPGRDMKDEGCEPIAAWRYYIRRVRAVLNIAAAIKQKKLGDLADWEQIGTVVPLGHYTRAKHEALQALFAQHKFGMGWHVLVQQDTLDENLANARVVLAGEISAWLDCWKPGRPRGISDFVLQWSQSQARWELLIDFHGLLFPAIAFQLALVVAEADSLYSCSGCGLPYVRARDRKRPKRGCANYCAGCAEKRSG